MPSKEPRTCPICYRPGIVNPNQHLNGVHGICGQKRKRLIQGSMIGTEVITREPQSNIEKHCIFGYASTRRSIKVPMKRKIFFPQNYGERCEYECLIRKTG